MNKPRTSLAASPALDKYLFEEAAMIILVLDRDGVILEANKYAREMAGQDITGKNISQTIVDFSGIFDLKNLIRQKQGPHLLNITSEKGLPQTFYFSFLRQEENILAVGELNHMEVETLRKNLMTLNNDFSNLNRELQKKNAELAKLNDLKNQFLGMAAHDLRNPIGAIQSLSEFLLEEAKDRLSEEHFKFVNVIHSSSRFMLSLLDQLLDIARIEAGKLELDIKPVNLVNLIKDCVDLNKIMADKKRIKIQFFHYESLPLVEMDAMKIEQVLHNLISNAIKFSPQETMITISVFLSGEYVTVSVADQGPGIPEEDIQKLYKPFSKTSVKLPEGEKSTGLGLAIVHKIVLGHMGKIWVESKVGEGSTFYFSLPVKYAA
ncbi:MAG: ATP-binding protein [Desulfonatronovibrio sp.]